MTAALRLPDKQDWTVDDLASLPSDLNYELIDGRLILPSPIGLHQILGIKIAVALEQACPEGYSPVTDYSMEVDRRNEPRPDVVVVHDSVVMKSPAPIDRAILVIEIISPTSHFRDMHAKAKVYAEAGVSHYWVVDPTVESGVTLTVFHPGRTGAYEVVVDTSKVFNTDVPYPITIDLPALTKLRDKYLAAQGDS
ncbi:Uma2 family endonuclease [Actinoplanes sp. NEAU-A12]|uniref:Uma2 family endonuclease n=1 Tax=Actinoplanes sandaracinus TaxID=3045177 RepID=A0ABT6WD19_9ACTN|nr:Uma2 family endonuclease [Actinoplanes sandaracinus]MDI6097639.1 Uma2 family endonuclease [Actinoplanes sandaracinus]